MNARLGAIFPVMVVAIAIVGSLFLAMVQPPVGMAAPSGVAIEELATVALLFLVYIALRGRGKVFLDKHLPFVLGVFERKVGLPRAARGLTLLAGLVCGFIFAFMAAVDVLGGYGGPGYSLQAYPVLTVIYNSVGLNYALGPLNHMRIHPLGAAAIVFFSLAFLAFTAFRLNQGVGTALKDAVTLFAAPSAIVCELELWHSAPEDMSWHASDLIQWGGVVDNGHRAAGGGGAYFVSNWAVLFVSTFVLAALACTTLLKSQPSAEPLDESACHEVGDGADEAAD